MKKDELERWDIHLWDKKNIKKRLKNYDIIFNVFSFKKIYAGGGGAIGGKRKAFEFCTNKFTTTVTIIKNTLKNFMFFCKIKEIELKLYFSWLLYIPDSEMD